MKGEAKRINYFLEIVKALIISLIISLALILLAALLIKLCNIPTNIIPIINQVIKGVSVLVACLIALRLPSNGWVRGIAVGVLYIALAFVVFSLLQGHFEWGWNILNDFAIGSITGLVSGIIAVNIKRRK